VAALSAASIVHAQLAFGSAVVTRPAPTVPAHASLPSQESYKSRFSGHNAAMAALQPTWPTPLVETDPRMTQYYRFALSSQYTSAGTQTVSYGNARGGGIVALNRFEFDFLPPPYIQHNSAAADGFGDCSVFLKARIVSANAEHGNYILTASGSHTFATGSAKNGALTDSWLAQLAGGIGLTRRINVESALNGSLPTGRIATQGRTVGWNALTQAHLTEHTWLELENNATFYFSGSHDGKMQNFVTPGAFYIFKRKEWNPTHPFLVFDGGMQIATSSFHNYNHNTIAEMRILF
jgi:hypothetical protein